MTEQPFKYGTAATGIHFTDRTEETARLVSNFRHGIHTILISPRRWGKTSLVKKAAGLAASEELQVVFLDIFACRSEEEFCTAFVSAVLRQTSSKWEEWLRNAQEFLARLSPKISLGTDPMTDMSFGLELKGKKEGIEEVLELPERIARKHKRRLVVCIDEFQQVGEFADSLTFQKKLRTVWQHQEQVSYCLFGSKKHLMNELFGRKDYPFYKFGDILYLGKIPTEEWVKYIRERFEATGKAISEKLARQICEAADNHSSYVQQLSWLVWSRAEGIAGEEAVEAGIKELLDQNTPLFEKMTEGLTGYQLSYLRALSQGTNEALTSRDSLEKYNLGSSANVAAVKAALLKREVIDTEGGRVFISDPVLKLWLRIRLFWM